MISQPVLKLGIIASIAAACVGAKSSIAAEGDGEMRHFAALPSSGVQTAAQCDDLATEANLPPVNNNAAPPTKSSLALIKNPDLDLCFLDPKYSILPETLATQAAKQFRQIFLAVPYNGTASDRLLSSSSEMQGADFHHLLLGKTKDVEFLSLVSTSADVQPLLAALPPEESPLPAQSSPDGQTPPKPDHTPAQENPPADRDPAQPPAAPVPPPKPALFDPGIPTLEDNYPRPKDPAFFGPVTSPPSGNDADETLAELDQQQVQNSPRLLSLYSDWDLAGIQSPLFGTEEITEFSQRPLSLEGKWKVRPHFSLTTLYDGNIFVQSTGVQSDFVTVLSPGLTFRIGNDESMFYVLGDYTLGAVLYAKHSSDDTINHTLKLDIQCRLPKTTFGLHVGVLDDSGTSIDVSNRVRRQNYYVGLTVHHLISEKTSWDINADYNQNTYNGLISSTQIQAQGFLNYDYSPKTTVGIGATLGYLDVQDAAHQTFEQGTFRLTYRSSEKLTFIADGGLEVRQYGGGGGTSVSPVFSLSAAWAVLEGTKIDLTARRANYASAILQGENYAATSFDLTITQRFTDKVSLMLSGGYVNTDYTSTIRDLAATRVDNYFYIRPAVQWRVLNWLSVGLFYEYSENASRGEGARGFTRDRGGVQFGITF